MSFSVVIPLYNKEVFIARALRSVLTQTVSPLEVLVVDDGSTDGGADVVRQFSDPRVRLLQQANAGPGAARNTGLQQARGEWVAFLDADDAWWPDHLEELSSLAHAQTQARMLATACLEVANDLQLIRVSSVVPSRKLIDYFAVASRDAGRVNSTCAAVRRIEALEIGGFSVSMRLGEDLDFWCRMACRWPVGISDKPTSLYYRGTQGAMETVAVASVPPKAQMLRDVSAPIPALLTHLEHCKDEGQRRSIVDYINSRVTCAVRVALWAGQVGQARHLAGLMIQPVSKNHEWWQFLSHLPQWVWLAFFHLRKVLRAAEGLVRATSGTVR